jgi:cell pole-organizing protein PopZ
MAEKNTLSILETIKKKMLKLDRKEEKASSVVSSNEEFQYISSGKQAEAAKPAEVKVEAVAATNPTPKFEDNLGLDLPVQAAPVKRPEKSSGMGSFDDFNLDDLDLDNEEKTFAAPANPLAAAAAAQPQAKLETRDPELEEDDAEEFEDDAEMDEEEEQENAEEARPDLDWLGNPSDATEEEEEIDELNLDVDVKLDEKSVEVVKSDELDLEHLEEETHEEVKKDELDLEHLEDDLDLEHLDEETHEETPAAPQAKVDDLDLEHLDDDLDLEHLEEEKHEEAPVTPQAKEDDLDLEHLDEDKNEETPAAPQPKADDLDLELEHLDDEEEHLEASSEDGDFDLEEELDEEEEDLEEEHEEETQPQAKTKLPTLDDDLNFDDLDHDEEDEKQELPTFLGGSATISQMTQPMTKQELPTFSNAAEPVVEKHEIDLEFEKDIMGFKAGASEEREAQVVNQPVNNSQMPVQNNVSMMSQQTSQTQVAEAKPFDSTVRQVSDSVKKLLDAKNVVSGISSFSQSPALAELALHLMEPKIEKWFNDNLPELVEKVVREEIKKMIPKD